MCPSPSSRPSWSCPRRRCAPPSCGCSRRSSSTRPRLFPTLEYTFKHALTHDVAYGSLLTGRRRALHARAMESLERLNADRLSEQVERLAHHAVRGEIVGARPSTISARRGRRPSSRAANQEAVALLDQALQALTHIPEGRSKLEQAIDIRLELRPPLLQLGPPARRAPALQGGGAARRRAGRRVASRCACTAISSTTTI